MDQKCCSSYGAEEQIHSHHCSTTAVQGGSAAYFHSEAFDDENGLGAAGQRTTHEVVEEQSVGRLFLLQLHPGGGNRAVSGGGAADTLKALEGATTIWRAGEIFQNQDHQTPAREGSEGGQLSCHSNGLCTEQKKRREL